MGAWAVTAPCIFKCRIFWGKQRLPHGKTRPTIPLLPKRRILLRAGEARKPTPRSAITGLRRVSQRYVAALSAALDAGILRLTNNKR